MAEWYYFSVFVEGQLSREPIESPVWQTNQDWESELATFVEYGDFGTAKLSTTFGIKISPGPQQRWSLMQLKRIAIGLTRYGGFLLNMNSSPGRGSRPRDMRSIEMEIQTMRERAEISRYVHPNGKSFGPGGWCISAEDDPIFYRVGKFMRPELWIAFVVGVVHFLLNEVRTSSRLVCPFTFDKYVLTSQ